MIFGVLGDGMLAGHPEGEFFPFQPPRFPCLAHGFSHTLDFFSPLTPRSFLHPICDLTRFRVSPSPPFLQAGPLGSSSLTFSSGSTVSLRPSTMDMMTPTRARTATSPPDPQDPASLSSRVCLSSSVLVPTSIRSWDISPLRSRCGEGWDYHSRF